MSQEQTKGEQTQSEELAYSPENVERLSYLGIKLEGNFGPLMEELRKVTRADLTPRPEGFHVTIISPTESKALASLNAEQRTELEQISAEIRADKGVEVMGIGFIDGSVAAVKDADKVKKTAFLALDIPALQEFRKKVGLPAKDFHVTLGFEVGDMHMSIIGRDEKGKAILGPIAKKADPQFAELWTRLKPELSFGGLAGKPKQEKGK